MTPSRGAQEPPAAGGEGLVPGYQGGATGELRPPVPRTARGLLAWQAGSAVTAVLCLLYLAVRASESIRFAAPPLAWTTGCEEEALFSLWKLLHGDAVYADTLRIPFAASYFNWLFYQVNGGVLKVALPLLGGAAEQIPNVARLTALAFQVAAVPVWIAIGRAAGYLPRSWTWQALTAAVCALFPLAFSLWTITCRPDTGALFLELCGVFFALRYLQGRRRLALVLSLLLFYGAWSFRQTNVSGVTALCLCLMARRDWRGLGLAVGLTWTAYAVTLAVGGADYVYALCFSQRHMGLSPALGIRNGLTAALRAPFFGVLPVLLAGALPRLRSGAGERGSGVPFIPLFCGVSLAFAALTSMKNGAYVNYYLPPAAAAALLVVGSVRQASRAGLLALAASAGLLAAQCAAIVLALAGWCGHPGLLDDQPRAALVRQELARCAPPVLVNRAAYNLPWIQPHPPHFVVAAAYADDARAGRPFEQGGVAGLVRRGYFGTVVVDRRAPLEHLVAPADLARHYELRETMGDVEFWGPRSTAGPPAAAGPATDSPPP